MYSLDDHLQNAIIYLQHIVCGASVVMLNFVFKNHLGSNYDFERIIDDWILMGFLVGNDFIPHLPHLHISHDALPLLYKTYINVLPSLGGEMCTRATSKQNKGKRITLYETLHRHVSVSCIHNL